MKFIIMDRLTIIQRTAIAIRYTSLAVILLFVLVGCIAADDEDDSAFYDIEAVSPQGPLLGDIDVVAYDVNGNPVTTRYYDIVGKCYQNSDMYFGVSVSNCIMINGFPCDEILKCIPGEASLRGDTPWVIFGYDTFDLSDSEVDNDAFGIRLLSYSVMTFTVEINGVEHQVIIDVVPADGIMTYDKLIGWKYSFLWRVGNIRIDGNSVDEYRLLSEDRKIHFYCNFWLMYGSVFAQHKQQSY